MRPPAMPLGPQCDTPATCRRYRAKDGIELVPGTGHPGFPENRLPMPASPDNKRHLGPSRTPARKASSEVSSSSRPITAEATIAAAIVKDHGLIWDPIASGSDGGRLDDLLGSSGSTRSNVQPGRVSITCSTAASARVGGSRSWQPSLLPHGRRRRHWMVVPAPLLPLCKAHLSFER